MVAPSVDDAYGRVLLAGILPTGEHVFDKVWESTAVGGLLLLVTALVCAVCWTLYKELKAEREAHRLAGLQKDEQLEKLNERFRNEMVATRQVTEGLIRQLEELQAEVKHNNMRPEFNQGLMQLKNGLRALGEEHGLKASQMNMDNGILFDH